MYNLVRRNKTNPISKVFNDNFFNDFFSDSIIDAFYPSPNKTRGFPLSNIVRSNSFYNVEENEEDISIKVNIPSFDEKLSKEDIYVSYEDGVLIISHSRDTDEDSKTNAPNEFYLQYAVRSSEYEIDTSKIDASLKGNILTVSLPKLDTVDRNTLKIEVK